MSVLALGFVREGEEEDHRVCRDLDKMLPLLRAARPKLAWSRPQPRWTLSSPEVPMSAGKVLAVGLSFKWVILGLLRGLPTS